MATTTAPAAVPAASRDLGAIFPPLCVSDEELHVAADVCELAELIADHRAFCAARDALVAEVAAAQGMADKSTRAVLLAIRDAPGGSDPLTVLMVNMVHSVAAKEREIIKSAAAARLRGDCGGEVVRALMQGTAEHDTSPEVFRTARARAIRAAVKFCNANRVGVVASTETAQADAKDYTVLELVFRWTDARGKHKVSFRIRETAYRCSTEDEYPTSHVGLTAAAISALNAVCSFTPVNEAPGVLARLRHSHWFSVKPHAIPSEAPQ